MTEIKMPTPGESSGLPPSGTYLAICYGIAFLGTVEEEYRGEPRKEQKIAILWELPTEKIVFDETKGEQPLSVNNTYNFKSGEKATLFKHINLWSANQITQANISDFNTTKLIGRPCLLTLEKYTYQSKGKEREDFNVVGISAVDKGREIPAQTNESLIFHIDEFEEKLFFRLPPLVRYVCAQSKEFEQKGLDYEAMQKAYYDGLDNKREQKESQSEQKEETGNKGSEDTGTAWV